MFETLQSLQSNRGGMRLSAKPPALGVEQVVELVVATLDDAKTRDIKVLDVRNKTSIADFMVIASGTSERHVRASAEQVIEKVKAAGLMPIGSEGQEASEWVLVDLGEVIVHVMKPQTREFYQLEKLWGVDYAPAAQA